LALEFLFLLGKTTKLGLSHLDVVPLILAVIVVAFSGTKMNLVHAVVFHIAATFLDYSVSEIVEEVGEFETSGSAIASTDSRHHKSP
jgi:uncharacterized membrane protein